jgi:hypothetical protein
MNLKISNLGKCPVLPVNRSDFFLRGNRSTCGSVNPGYSIEIGLISCYSSLLQFVIVAKFGPTTRAKAWESLGCSSATGHVPIRVPSLAIGLVV